MLRGQRLICMRQTQREMFVLSIVRVHIYFVV